MSNQLALPKIGAPFGDGFFAGEIIVDEGRYALIVAPKATGEQMEVQYKPKDLDTGDVTDSDDDGMINSEKINNDEHPAAKFCRSLRIGNHDDWYLPSRDELMRIWMALGPNRKNTPEQFRSGGSEAFAQRWYWSSTEDAPYSGYAWIVGFGSGYQLNDRKNGHFGVRAVRRLKI